MHHRIMAAFRCDLEADVVCTTSRNYTYTLPMTVNYELDEVVDCVAHAMVQCNA